MRQGGADAARAREERPFGGTQYYQMQNVLVRTVGAAMVLEAARRLLADRSLQ